MRTPGALSGKELIKFLSIYGYTITTQRKKITIQENGEYHLARSNPSPLKIGTPNGIITQVANHFSVTKNQVFENLY